MNMSLEEFKQNFSSKIEEKKEDSEREQISKVLKKKFNVGFKVLYGDIYVFTDGQVGLGLRDKNIQSIQKIDWNFESTYFSININKIIVDAEVIIDGEVQNVKFEYVIPKSQPDEDEELFEDEVEIKEISYNDGQASRDRQASLVIFSKNRGYVFDGKHIPGVCTITKSLYSKNGKWSNTTYTIVINKGYKISRLRESWGLGYFINVEYDSDLDLKSIDSFKESLGMSEMSDESFIFLVKHAFKKEYIKYCLVQENLETF